MDGAVMELDGSGGEDEANNIQPYDWHQLGYNPQVQNGGYDPQLENVRMESIRKIRGRFEHIYQKYGRDFEGVGDEIDMATGVIVVNNGHLQGMEHEVDAGNGDAMALSRTFEDEGEDEEGESSSSDGDADAGSDAENESHGAAEDPELDFSWQNDTATSHTSPDEDSNPQVDLAQTSVGRQSTPTNFLRRSKRKDRESTANVTTEPPSDDSRQSDIFGQMAGLKDSMLALQDKYRHGQDMAPDDIQALGMSIANQLASFITRGKGSKKRKRQTLPARLQSPDESRGRRRKRSHSPVNPVAPTPARSPGSKSLWAPLEKPKVRKNGKKKAAPAAAEEEQQGDDSLLDSLVLQSIMHQSALEPDELQGPTTVRSCSNCKTTETTVWRKGPDGLIDLCNNCGMYYYRYGLTRPLNESSRKERPGSTKKDDDDTRAKSAKYSANTSRPLDGVNLFGLHFSVREDAQLIKLKEIDGLTWDEIAIQHPGRTPFALQCRYSKWLHGKQCEARDILRSRGYEFYIDTNGNAVARQPGQFSDEEEDLLLKLHEEDHLSWDEVALQLPGRTAEDIERRYDEMVVEFLGTNSSEESGEDDHSVNLGPSVRSQSKKRRRDSNASDRSSQRYTPAEDDLILRLREDDRMSWQEVAKQLPGRTLHSVQRRYSRDIGPYGRSRSSTPRGSPAPGESPSRPQKYSSEEDAVLMRLRDEAKLDWEQIAEQIPDRSASSLENRYYYKVRKDDSRGGSRTSSVAASEGRSRARSLPAVDLEAQLEALQDSTPSAEDTFTDAEDELIIKLRELESLSWDQIALEMPDRTVSSISCRYYQYLLPRKVPEIRKTEQMLDPTLHPSHSPSGTSQATTSGAQARLQDRQFDELADTSASSGTVADGSSNAKKRKSDGITSHRTKAVRRSDAPMLRRALQKNLNRRSESKLASPASLSMPMTDGANYDVIVDDELFIDRMASRQSELLPSALPEDDDFHDRNSQRALRSGSKRKSAYPETPLRTNSQPYPTSGPTPIDSGFYITPSKYQIQSNPYFLDNAASPELPPNPYSHDERSSHDSENEVEDEMVSDQVRRSSRKRRRAPKSARAARPRRTSAGDTDEGEDEDDGDDTAGEYFTSRKKKRSAGQAQKSFRGRASASGPKRNERDRRMEEEGTLIRTPRAEDETEEEDIDMPDLGTDDDEASSDSPEEEEEDDDDLRCKPRERSPLFDPRAFIQEAKQRKESGPLRGKLPVNASNGSGDPGADIDISAIPPEDRLRPDLSWTQLNFMALKSQAPEPMLTRDVYVYLENRFPFFRLCKGHWRDSIRGNLSTRPEFVKHSDDKAALWCLANPDQDCIPVPKGGRRGRCPDGVTREPKEPMEPKQPKKRGRPSNASKGLPLKRIYKRNYIPAAERQRLAALETADADDRARINATTAGAEATESSRGSAHRADGREGAAEDGDGARPARPSTIEDSDADDTFDFIGNPFNPTDPDEVKTESVPPESVFIAPEAPMAAPADTGGEQQSSDSAGDAATAIDELSSDITPLTIEPGLQSSPPASTRAYRQPRYNRAAATVATPGTARSTLFRQLAPAPSAIKATPAFAQMAKMSRVATPSSLRRTVQTPARDAKESEDELA